MAACLATSSRRFRVRLQRFSSPRPQGSSALAYRLSRPARNSATGLKGAERRTKRLRPDRPRRARPNLPPPLEWPVNVGAIGWWFGKRGPPSSGAGTRSIGAQSQGHGSEAGQAPARAPSSSALQGLARWAG